MNTNRIKVAGIGLGMAGAQGATNNAPADQSDGTTSSAAAQQVAFGVESIKLGGVFGHRLVTMIKSNLYMSDPEGFTLELMQPPAWRFEEVEKNAKTL